MYSTISVTGGYGEISLAYFFISHTFEIMTLIFLTFIILFIINFKTIKKSFSKIKKKTLLILFLIFILGFWLRNGEYRYGDGLDSFFPIDIAKTLYKNNLFLKGCAIGNLDFCRLYHGHLFPPGYPYLITILFYIFGAHDILAMYISGLLSSLTIILIFCITYLLFSDERKGLYAALVFTLIPLDIFISSTSAVRPTSVFFISLSILFYLIALKKDNIKIWSLVTITFSYAIYINQENVILIIPMLTGLFLFKFFRHDDLKTFENIKKSFYLNFKKFSIPILIFIITQIPVQHWVIFGKAGRSSEKLFYLKNAKILIPEIVSSIFFKNNVLQKNFFLPIASIFFLISLLFTFDKKNRNKMLFILIWFFVYLIIISSYFQCGGFPDFFCTEYIRYMQYLVIPYAIMAGFTFSIIEEKIEINKNIILFVIAAILIFSSGIESRPDLFLFRDKRLSEDFVLKFVESINKTPKNSLLLIDQSAIPMFDYFYGTNRRWIDTNLITANNYLFTIEEMENRGNQSLILIDNGQCFGLGIEGCEFIYNNFELDLLFEVKDFKIYNLTQKYSNLLIPKE